MRYLIITGLVLAAIFFYCHEKESQENGCKQEAQIIQTMCPVTGLDINTEFSTRFEGEKIYFHDRKALWVFKTEPFYYYDIYMGHVTDLKQRRAWAQQQGSEEAFSPAGESTIE